MFDLPSVTNKELRFARKWHKFLINTGFIMMTESVYSRLAINKSVSASIKKMITKNLPPKGDVQLLEVTEKQFASIEYYLGKSKSNIIDINARYIEI